LTLIVNNVIFVMCRSTTSVQTRRVHTV